MSSIAVSFYTGEKPTQKLTNLQSNFSHTVNFNDLLLQSTVEGNAFV